MKSLVTICLVAVMFVCVMVSGCVNTGKIVRVIDNFEKLNPDCKFPYEIDASYNGKPVCAVVDWYSSSSESYDNPYDFAFYLVKQRRLKSPHRTCYVYINENYLQLNAKDKHVLRKLSPLVNEVIDSALEIQKKCELK